MTKYYLKMDNIMKNMFVVALNDELQAQSEQDECLEETKALLKKVSEYDLAQKRLQITAGEQRQIRKALNLSLIHIYRKPDGHHLKSLSVPVDLSFHLHFSVQYTPD